MLAPKTTTIPPLNATTLCTGDLDLAIRVPGHGVRINLLGRPAIAARLAAQHAKLPLVVLRIPGRCGTATVLPCVEIQVVAVRVRIVLLRPEPVLLRGQRPVP